MKARVVVAVIVSLVAAVSAGVLVACSQTPTSVPIRTFERAQKVDVICLRVFGENAPEALKQEECAPVPPDVNGGNLQNQLFALVTQTRRGEIAVVDLSAGTIIDQSQAVPGLNFLPVGALPTDIATTPDGRMAFVASAEANKYAIYGIPGHRILGDKAPRRDPDGPITLASWPVCALPQRPGSLTVVPRRTVTPVTPESDAGADAGASPTTTDVPYELVAVLPGDRTSPAKGVTLDPRPFLRAVPRRDDVGQPLDDFGEGDKLVPGQLMDCPITSAIELAGEQAVPDAFRPGRPWEDGVKWVDGGIDLSCDTPPSLSPTRCGLRPCKCVDPTTGQLPGSSVSDGGSPDEPACEPDAGTQEEVAQPSEFGPLDAPRPVAMARDDQTLYIADDALPLIHVVDLSTPGAPRELPPFVVSSLVEPSRVVSIRDVAVSPPTREYKRYLYAVDRKEGSIAVFDITDPVNAERTPMRRPHPELNPFQPPDRIAFAAPVVAVAFARNDFPLARINGVAQASAKSGLLCNPNENAAAIDPATGIARDPGVYYRASSQDVDVGLGPSRLRGIFAFATLSNGQVVAIDVDDWDAPCRRPLTLTGPSAASDVPVGVLAVGQPEPTDGDDLDPYHAPNAPPESVSQELFFPVSSPHRPRSAFLLRDDPRTGRHFPFLTSTPSISSVGAVTPPLAGPGSERTPRLRPTAVRPGGTAAGTADVGIRFSIDTPDVHFDQDWTVTYEGALPGFEGLPATLSTTDGYQTLILTQEQARFCAKGVEDWAVGGERANAVANALAEAERAPYPERIDRRMLDYVQVTDELLPADDGFWRQPDLPEPNSCWEGGLNPADPNNPAQVEEAARQRHEYCTTAFGPMSEERESRDFPILEAYEDHLVLGAFGVVDRTDENATREVIASDPWNAPRLKAMRCCFHHQVRFKVRAASQWVTVGSTVGFLSHLEAGPGGRCVTSCDPREALLNGRAPSLPGGAAVAGAPDFAPFRDSPLAMRNPAFSFFVQNGQDATRRNVLPERDMAYRFQTRGQFTPLVINLAAQTTAVNPQSMRFIESLGQIAVVDGASQGLVLIDLAGVAIARAPYF